MDINSAMKISASGMRAQGARLRVIAENLANAQSTASSPDGLPYRRKTITFANEMDRALGVEAVKVKRIGVDSSDFQRRYEPGHPSADAQGYVLYPNVNSLIEAMDMREAQRSYEANVNVIDASKTMLMRTLDIIRS
ncbi:MAG TPA: flagellar basal body rod protein FlgC [Azospirillaceae bacterium]|nr:flagellar basal body rod protein FlgC [Azospirillaceae bacterium]